MQQNHFVLVTILSIFLILVAFQYPSLPTAHEADAPPAAFSAHRALEHVRSLAGEPRPTGSPGNERARQYLIEQLRAIGPELEIETQPAAVVRGAVSGLVSGARLENVIARLPGTDSSGTILLMAHYDSVPNGPGANDDAAGTSVVLESLRALYASGPHRNDVIALLTDAEERGMLGARAFYEQHPLGKTPAAILNFEARGNTGVVLMFETGANNHWLIREFAATADRIAASSVAAALFRILPYGTDLAPFKEGGLSGLNFAYIDGPLRYHSVLDNADSVDPRSLQHDGDLALPLTRRLAAMDLTATRESSGDAIFFNVGNRLVYYSTVLAWPLFVLACAGYVFFVYLAFGHRGPGLRAGGSMLGFFAVVLGCVLVPLLLAGTWWLVRLVLTDYAALAYAGEVYQSVYFKFAFAILAVLGCVLLWRLWLRWFRFVDLLHGGIIFWLLAGALTTALVPAASYLFTLPMIVYTPCAALSIVRIRKEPSLHTVNLTASGALLALFLFVSLARFLLFQLLNVTTFAAGSVLIVVLFVLYVPALAYINARSPMSLAGLRRQPPWRFAAAALLVVFIVLLTTGLVRSRFGRDQPRPNSVVYALNADDNAAHHLSCDVHLDAWTRAFFPPDRLDDDKAFQPYIPVLKRCIPGWNRPHRAAASVPERPGDLRAPAVDLLVDRRTVDGRRLRLRWRSRRDAPVLFGFLRPTDGSSIAALSVDGVAVELPERQTPGFLRSLASSAVVMDDWTTISYAISGRRKEIIIEVELTAAAVEATPGLELRLMDHTTGLPAFLAAPPRPAGTMPGMRYPFGDGAFVYVRRVF